MSTEAAGQAGGGDYIGILRRRLPYVLTIAPIILLVSVFFAFFLTPQYQSTATILLEPSSIPKDVVTTTVISYSDQQIEIVQGRVMTLDTLKELVKELDPYPNEKNLSTSKKAQRILEDTSLERVDPVTMKPLVESNAFSLHYRNPDSERAASVANHLAQLFLTYNQRSRTEAARSAAVFLAKESESVSEQMREIDVEISKIKTAHGDALPELQLRNEASLDRGQRDLDALQQQILAAEEKESLFSVQLSQMSPNLMTQAGSLTDVATVRAQLAEAQQKYTPNHPDVKRLQRALETLMAQGASTAPGTIKADNPQYLALQSQLDSTRKELANLQAQANKTRVQNAQYEQYLRNTPGVERDYSEIMRRRQALQTQYQQIHDRLQNAQLAQTFEAEQQGERFTLLRAPLPARNPVYPNRIGLILLGLFLGCGLAAIAIAIAESTDSNIRNARDLPDLGDAPLLASIPVILNPRTARRRRLITLSIAAAYSVAILIVGSTVVAALT